MLIKTQAVCIKSFPYKESSTVVSLFTKESGLKTCIIKGGRKKNATVKSSYFQPLQLLDVVLYYNNKSSFCQVKECHLAKNLNEMYTNMVRISLSLFAAEVLTLSLKEDNPNEDMFAFLSEAITYLNDCGQDKDLKDFHIYFLYHLARHLGFEPMNNYSRENPFFDIAKGSFIGSCDIQTLDTDTSLLFYKFLCDVGEECTVFTSDSLSRSNLLNVWILFFEQHITNNRPVKSQKILHTLF